MAADVLITKDNHKVSFEHFACGHSQVVIIAHGFFNSKESPLLKKLKDSLICDYDVIMFDFRGHGKSSGLFSWTSRENLDLEAVLDYAKKEYKKIGLIGFSFGAAISIAVLAKVDAASAFIAISSPSEFEKIDYRFWDLDVEEDIFYNLGKGKAGKGVRPGAFWLKKPKPVDLVRKIKCPVFYIHGDKDWVVRHWHSQRLFENTQAKKEIKIIKGGTHAEYLLRKEPQKIIDLIKEWLNDNLRNGG